MSKQKENDNDISSPNLIIEDVTPVDGIPEYLLFEESSTTLKIKINEYDIGFTEGKSVGEQRILSLIKEMLLNRKLSANEVAEIIDIIAERAGIIYGL